MERKLNPAHVEAVCRYVSNSPYFKLLSMELRDMGFGWAVVTLNVLEKHLQAFGFVHGGLCASVIDTAAFWSAYCELDEDVGITTTDLKVNYLSPFKSGVLTVRGHCIKMGKTLGLTEATINDERGRIISHGTSTLVVLPGHGLAGSPDLPPKFL
ncbi:MAG TPA: PaaI family thioesterase [Syntrophales bacterium]|nr:PaaI family thioesterase [Syntrophales bacterium]HOM06597.1 PaaI family thioesterase [Syntrophales bacterium]HON99620.1 PaaI family thioesterase [Syntrophales bacterium]HPC00709.1 PaaI family thioesterase [Syntrophales bacterium]HPQ06141.1 PaaI family thioesterase [Syntrophales bacterium]